MAFILRGLSKLRRRPFTTVGLMLSGGCGTAVALTEADPSRQPDGRIGGLIAGGHGILRSSRAISTFAANSFDYKYSLLKVELQGTAARKSPEWSKVRSEIHLRSAQRLLKLCESNRGIYIKAGQFVASLQHLPKEYTSTLSVLQDQARGRPFAMVEKVIEEQLGHQLSDLFLEFDEKPIAAASLAQVHRAVLKDGRQVAVKVQYPGLRRQVETDIATMGVLSKAVAWLFPDYQFSWIVPEFEQNLSQQLDFVLEGTNAERAAGNFQHKKTLVIPEIEWNLTTRKVLTMEFMKGCKVTDVEGIRRQGLDPNQVADVLVEIFAEMIFCHGYVHGDPHPGNLLVKANPNQKGSRKFDLILLDHGLYRELDEDFRSDFCRLWKALILADKNLIQTAGERLGAGPYSRFLPVLFTGRPANSNAALGEGMTEAEARQLSKDFKLVDIGQLTAVIEGLPKDVFLVMRTDSLVRQIIGQLGASPRQRLLINAKYAVTGLAYRRRSENVNNHKLPLGVYMKAQLDYINLLLRLEIWQRSLEALAAWEMLILHVRIWRLWIFQALLRWQRAMSGQSLPLLGSQPSIAQI